MRILHIGDLHFHKIPLNPITYLGKRALGVANLLIGGRRRRFRTEEAPRFVEYASGLAPDFLFFSGDFTSTALASEFQLAAKALEPLLPPTREGCVHTVPGNHDCYTGRELTGRTFFRVLGTRFGCEREMSLGWPAEGLALLKINAATRNGIGSHGRVLARHLLYLESVKTEIQAKARSLIVLCHFPAEEPAPLILHDRGPQLLNAPALLDVLATLNIPVLWLHGHHHHRWTYGSPRHPAIKYLNAGAPFLRKQGHPPDLGFHELTFSGGAISIRTHRFDHQAGRWDTRQPKLPEPGEYEDLEDPASQPVREEKAPVNA